MAISLLLASGCANLGDPSSEPRRQAWIQRQGGVLRDQRIERASQAGAALVSGRFHTPIRIQVLDSDQVTAYAWPDGSIFVTRALVSLLDDEELAAAIAHELGHLLNDGHLQTCAALRGFSRGCDTEEAADQSGCQLLQVAGFAPEAMVRMLRKVKEASAPDRFCCEGLNQRIQALSRQHSHQTHRP